MIYLDTHVVLWLYEGMLEKISKKAVALLEKNDLLISPIVQLEITYLHEVKRCTYPAVSIIDTLKEQVGLGVCDLAFEEIITKANKLIWTRDPFDRIIVAQAMCRQTLLLTKDTFIRKHTKTAVWD